MYLVPVMDKIDKIFSKLMDSTSDVPCDIYNKVVANVLDNIRTGGEEIRDSFDKIRSK